MIDVNFWQHLPKWINKIYYKWLFDNRRYNIYYGGASSGKSFFIAEKILYLMIQEEGHNFLVIRKSDRDNRYSTYVLLKQVINFWGINSLFIFNKTSLTITCILNNNCIVFRGLDDQEKLKSITFETGCLTDIWVEEATQITYKDFMQLKLRLRGMSKVRKQMILSFNPISNLHWAKKVFFDNPMDKEQCGILKTTYLDNKFLTEEDRNEIEQLKNYDEHYYKIYGLGEWGILGNLVFHNYEIYDFDHDEDFYDIVCNGLDFGFVHAQALIRIGVKDDEIYIFDELYAKGMINSAFIISAKEQFPSITSWQITADSANPDKIKEWNDEGIRVDPAKKGAGSVRFGIEYLSGKKLHIHASKCPNTAREIQMFKRREDKNGNCLEEYVELNDDTIAAIRYGTEYIWNIGNAGIAEYSASALGL